MARAFGDFCLKDFGLISVPEISCRCLTEKDEFVVLASDGVGGHFNLRCSNVSTVCFNHFNWFYRYGMCCRTRKWWTL